MPLALLNGTTGTQEFSTGPSTPKTWAGILNYISIVFDRDFFQQTVFGSSRWSRQITSAARMSGRNEGYLSTGVANSDPIYLFSGTTSLPFTATLETGCTVAGNLWASREEMGTRALGNSEFAFNWVGDGAPTTVWVTS
jgi:hypothetical protein